MVIYREIGAPGHGKNVVDVLNSMDNKPLMSVIINLYVPED